MPVRKRHGQRGQAIALFALALSAIVLGVAIVVDGGYAYAQRRVAQNAADFAAMAGTRVVGMSKIGQPATATHVQSAISATLTANNDAQLVSARYVDEEGADRGDVFSATSIPNDAFGVVVEANTDWSPFLLGLIGVDSWTASAPATAMTTGESDGGAVLPVGIQEDFFDGLDSCPADELISCLQQPLTPGHQIPEAEGTFGWLTFGIQGGNKKCEWDYSLGMTAMSADGGKTCSSDNGYLQEMIWPDPDDHGCCTAVGAPDPITGTPSEDKIGAHQGNDKATLEHYIGPPAIPVWVPIYSDCVKDSGEAYCNIVGFGAIVFRGEDEQHAKWLQGARVETPWCAIDGHEYCLGPGGSFIFGATGEVQLRR